MIGSNANARGNQQLDESKYEDALRSYTMAFDQAEGENNDEHRAMAMYGLARTHAQLCHVTDAEKWFRDSIALRGVDAGSGR